jgi:hypothetical protein
MLTIRASQMETLARSRRMDFERRLTAHLERVLTDRGISIDRGELERHVSVGVASGLRFFRAEKDVARYCEIVMTRAGNWDKEHSAPALEMLSPEVIDPRKRLDNFERCLTRRWRR